MEHVNKGNGVKLLTFRKVGETSLTASMLPTLFSTLPIELHLFPSAKLCSRKFRYVKNRISSTGNHALHFKTPSPYLLPLLSLCAKPASQHLNM